MGTPVDFYVVESIVESVYNSKIPDLMEVMRDVRARNLGRFDAEALQLEENILCWAIMLMLIVCRGLVLCPNKKNDLELGTPGLNLGLTSRQKFVSKSIPGCA